MRSEVSPDSESSSTRMAVPTSLLAVSPSMNALGRLPHAERDLVDAVERRLEVHDDVEVERRAARDVGEAVAAGGERVEACTVLPEARANVRRGE